MLYFDQTQVGKANIGRMWGRARFTTDPRGVRDESRHLLKIERIGDFFLFLEETARRGGKESYGR